jgi:hypothetical protein
LVAGSDSQFLNDSRSDTVGIEFRYDGQNLRAGAVGEQRWLESTNLSYDVTRSTQFLSYNALSNLTLGLNAEESFYRYSNPNRASQSFSSRATATYMYQDNLFVDGFAGFRRSQDTEAPTEQVNDVGLRARWRYAQLEISPSVQFSNRKRGDSDSKEFRAIIELIRRFSYP